MLWAIFYDQCFMAKLMTNQTCRVVVLISGNGSNLQALIDQQAAGLLPIDIVAVISNRPNVMGLQRAAKANIPHQVVDHTEFDSRELFDTALQQCIQQFTPDLVVLAGYMRIMTADLVRRFAGKMLNIHPSLLPKYPGLHTHKRALDNKDLQHGSSVHFVTEELDGGPVIAQSQFDIQPGDTEDSLAIRIKQLEHKLYPQVVGWFAENKIALQGNQALYNGEKLLQPKMIQTDL